eukprot:TRINITY_DN5112_c0_g6_i1.p1 TRINITY_DN5112_c0_g6~~TRINITY_DN5112_c0_g6_i1.p1  ORF type:complete len:407 (+),score=114.80 TRINITY_DN5112_c0_g6_i1:74-1294(+)
MASDGTPEVTTTVSGFIPVDSPEEADVVPPQEVAPQQEVAPPQQDVVSAQQLAPDAVPRRDDPVIPEDVIRLYARIHPKMQNLVHQAGVEARAQGTSMDLRVSELEAMTHLTQDDVNYASLLLDRGEGACVIVATLLKRAEHLSSSQSRPPPQRREMTTSVSQVYPHMRTLSPSRRDASPSTGRPVSSGYIPLFTPPSVRSRSPRGQQRSVTPKHPTRAYGTAVVDFMEYRELSRDRGVNGPDTGRYGMHMRPQTMSPPPESVKRCEVIGKLDPHSIAGKMVKAANSGGAMRSRSARIPAAKEPVTQVQYSVPGMSDLLKHRAKQSRVAAFGSSVPSQAASYLPREVQTKVQRQKREQRRARLTAAATQDASTIIKNAMARKRNPSPPSFTPREYQSRQQNGAHGA